VAHLSEQDLVLLALGEPQTTTEAGEGAWAHLHSCPECSAELAAFRHVVDLGRESADDRGPTPSASPQLWAGIADALDHDPGEDLPPAPVSLRRTTPGGAAPDGVANRVEPNRAGRGRRRWIIAAAVAAALVLGVGAGVLVGRATVNRSPATASTSAALAPVAPSGPAEASGTATITGAPEGATLTVTTAHLPLRQGFYQVWLYDQAANKMVPVGTLDSAGTGTFTVAPSIDVRSFNTVDISAQELNGDPAHGTSMLRGTLTQ
jgi:hypothetical protein